METLFLKSNAWDLEMGEIKHPINNMNRFHQEREGEHEQWELYIRV